METCLEAAGTVSRRLPARLREIARRRVIERAGFESLTGPTAMRKLAALKRRWPVSVGLTETWLQGSADYFDHTGPRKIVL